MWEREQRVHWKRSLWQRRRFALEPHLGNKWTFKVCTAEESVYTICLCVANVITHSLNQHHHFSHVENLQRLRPFLMINGPCFQLYRINNL